MFKMFWKKDIDSKGKAVLITGCDSGFGNRLALRLNSRGFRVYATVLDPNSMGSQELIEKSHFKDIMSVIQMDVTNEQQINDCFNTINNELEANNEQLWALVNNAGVVTYGLLEWGKFEEYRRVFDVNVFGVIRVTRKFIPLLRPTKGRIIIMASLGGRVTADLLGAYCMSKSALISFSDALRREMRKFDINVITIEPSVFKTAMFYSFNDNIENNWKNTDESVRQIYGDNYYENFTRRQNKSGEGLPGVGKDLDIVVEDMIKALVSVKPKRYYRPVNGKINRFFAQFIDFIPQKAIDRYFDRLNNNQPKYMIDEKVINNN